MLHVNLHHFLLTTETSYIDTDGKYRPVFQGEIIFVIIVLGMAIFVSFADLETTGKKNITNYIGNYIMEQFKIILNILQTDQTFVALQRKTNIYEHEYHINPCNRQAFPTEDFYLSEFWSTPLVDSIPGTISTCKSQQFCHSVRIALGQDTMKHNCHRQRGIKGVRKYKHRSFWVSLPRIFPTL